MIKKHEQSHTHTGEKYHRCARYVEADSTQYGRVRRPDRGAHPKGCGVDQIYQRQRVLRSLTLRCETRNSRDQLIRRDNAIKSLKNFFKALNYIYNMKKRGLSFSCR